MDMVRELGLYLWDNYVETGDSTHVIFLGIGNAHYGIVELYKSHPEILKAVDLTVGFVAENRLLGVTHPDDDTVPKRYHGNSLILVANNHQVWDPEGRKPKKRHGRLVQSDFNRIQEMLRFDRDRVYAAFEARTEGWTDQSSPDDERGSPNILHDRGASTAMELDPQSPRHRQISSLDGASEGFITQVQRPSPIKMGHATPPIGYFSTTPKSKPATPTKP